MLKFWSKIGLFLQIAIVIAGVILFNLFDPFGWLKSKKQTLEDTPISVRSIREIGKFISSEYYGEVLTSLQEAFIDDIKEGVADDTLALQEVEAQFKEAIQDLHERKSGISLRGFNKRKKLYELIYKEYPITSHPYYQTYISLVMKNHEEKNEKKFLKKLYDQPDLDTTNLTVDYAAFEVQLKKDIAVMTGDKKFRKSQIVVLGRGWVKAGIDFGTFNESNFKYDKDNKTIHLVGMKPEILFSTINPWFIPEKQIKGFEVIVITNRAKKPEYMHKVKSQSLKKLRQQAIQSGILLHAKKNAEENLKNFFSLLIPDGIDEVIIHDSFLSYFDASFVTDSLTSDIMQSIDSLFMSRYHSDSLAVVSLRDTIVDKKVYSNGKAFSVNRYGSRIQMAEDGVLSDNERKWLIAEKESLEASHDGIINNQFSTYRPHRLDSIWFLPEQAIINQFRKEVNDTSTAKFSWSKIISDHPDYLADQKNRKDALSLKVHAMMLLKKISALEELSMSFQKNVKQVVIGSTTYLNSGVVEKDTVIQGQAMKTTSELDTLFISIEDGIHSWKAPNAMETVELIEFEKLTEDLKSSWGIDDKCVFNMRDKILTYWNIQIDSKVYPVSRFVRFHSFNSDRVLDEMEIEKFLQVSRELKTASNYISYVDLKEQELIELRTKNDILSQILYYPDPSKLETYKKAAESKKYWATGKKKKLLKPRYVEFQIQRDILIKKKEDFDKVVRAVLLAVETVSSSNEKYSKAGDGTFKELPEELEFLNEYLTRSD